MAVTGVSIDFGLSNTNVSEANVKQAMLQVAREVILLADNTRIGMESLIKIGPLESVDKLIVDDGISSQHSLAMSERGVDVLVARGGSSWQ